MNNFQLLIKNLNRNRVRMILTGGAIVMAFALYGVLASLHHAFSYGVELAGSDRLITIHKASLLQLLPVSYQKKIESIDNLDVVSHFTWFGGYYQDRKKQFPVFPTEPELLLKIYNNYSYTEVDINNWLSNKTGLLVGRTLAESMNWKVGDRISLGSTIFENKNGNNIWEFTIEAIYTGSENRTDEYQAFFHYDYFNDTRTYTVDEVGWFVSIVSESSNSASVAKNIDMLFENSSNETKTSTEKGFVQSFADQIGDIGKITIYILIVVVFSIFLVTSNMITQSVNERINEIGVLKTLGFSDNKILKLVVNESVVLTVACGIFGLILSYFLIGSLQFFLMDYLPGLELRTKHVLFGIFIMVLLGVLSAIFPAIKAMQLTISDAISRRN